MLYANTFIILGIAEKYTNMHCVALINVLFQEYEGIPPQVTVELKY